MRGSQVMELILIGAGWLICLFVCHGMIGVWQDYIDAMYSSREDWIMESVLSVDEIVLEPNMFPYDTPSGIEHWTLWCKRDLTLQVI